MGMLWIAIGVGGALGSMLRHGVNLAAGRLIGAAVPYGTAAVNIVGCACIGLLAGALAQGRIQMSAPLRALVFVGILGGFTTFSSFGLDTLMLVQDGRRAAAAASVALQVGVGLAAVFAGFAAVR